MARGVRPAAKEFPPLPDRLRLHAPASGRDPDDPLALDAGPDQRDAFDADRSGAVEQGERAPVPGAVEGILGGDQPPRAPFPDAGEGDGDPFGAGNGRALGGAGAAPLFRFDRSGRRQGKS